MKPIRASTIATMIILFAAPVSLFYFLYDPVFGARDPRFYLYMFAMVMCFFCGFLSSEVRRNFWDAYVSGMGPITLDTHIAVCVEMLARLTKDRVTWVRQVNEKEQVNE